MRLSNFRNYSKNHLNSFRTEEFATVDVTTGFIWKRIKPRRIMKENVHWFFTDSGEFTPGGEAEALARAYHAQQKEANNV